MANYRTLRFNMNSFETTYHPVKITPGNNRHTVFFQPKLTINNPNDEYEKEADAMADKVMRMQQPFIQTKPLPLTSVQRKCAHCEEEEEKKAQRKDMNGSETNADHTLESYVGNLNGSGQSLSNEVRNFYEPRFGYDFSNVRVHTDSVAAKSTQSINAMAYTSGNNIVFNSGQYSPNTDSGKRLLGHELTHVVQQNSALNNTIGLQKMGTDEEDVMRKSLPGNASNNGHLPRPFQLMRKHRVEHDMIQKQPGPGSTPTPAPPSVHPKAVSALANMLHYKIDEKILFDWWANDCRDNDKDGLSDMADPDEGGSKDGAHYPGTYRGYTVEPGVTCRSSDGGWWTIARRVEIMDEVKYRVCADLISQAWTDAGVPMGHRRSVVDIINYIRHNRHWRWWPIASFRGPYMPGDMLFSKHGGLGHSAMVVFPAPAAIDPIIIHLPGQTQMISTGQYRPHIPNDVQIEPWWGARVKYGVGRYIG